MDFLLTAKRGKAAARRYLERAINLHGLPEKITIDKSGANTAAIHSVNVDACLEIELRQCKYLNNIVEQDHRAVKRNTRPMLGFKSFRAAKACHLPTSFTRWQDKSVLHKSGGTSAGLNSCSSN